MLARFEVALPWHICVTVELTEQDRSVSYSVGGEDIVLRLPYRSSLTLEDTAPLTVVPLDHIPGRLTPAIPQPIEPMVQVDSKPVVRCDALRIEFKRPEFTRGPGWDPLLLNLAFSVANHWLTRLRLLSRAAVISTLSPATAIWRLELRKDDGTPLPPEPGKECAWRSAITYAPVIALTDSLWQAVSQAPGGHQAESSTALLIDAEGALPDVKVAIVLAYTALEVRVAQVLDILAPMLGIPTELWGWINTRGKDHTKTPSTEEQFDVLLKALTRRSLNTERPALWEKFKNLRTARNRFVHEGVPTVGNAVVDGQTAASLVVAAGEILAWLDSLIPEHFRSPRYTGTTTISGIANIAAPSPEEVANDD